MVLRAQYMLVNGSYQYQNVWENMTIPLKFDVYFFNVTNPEEVHNGARPIVKEIGPVCYNLFRDKIVLDVSEDKEIITYYNRRFFYFTQERPGCVKDDIEITVLNFALMGMLHTINNLAPNMLGAFEEILPYFFPGLRNIFIVTTPRKLLFDGLVLNCSADHVTLNFACHNMKSLAPPQLQQHENGVDYVFSAFKYLNGTNEGPFTINSGIKNVSLIGYTLQWNGKSKIDKWGSEDCNTLKGHDGYVITPINNAKRLYIFQSDVCRSIYVDFEEKTEMFGFKALKYVAGKDLFDPSEKNKCYCAKKFYQETEEYKEDCLKYGVMNLSPCLIAPVIMSWPHFYAADKEYQNYVIGLNSNKEKHENTIYYEPVTSIPLKGLKRGQINLFLIQMEEISILNNVSEGLFPIMWIEEGADIPQNYRTLLKIGIYALNIFDIVKVIIVLVGLSLCAYAVIIFAQEKNLCLSTNDKVYEITEYSHSNSGNSNRINNKLNLHKDPAFSALEFSANSSYLAQRNFEKNNKNDVYVSHF